MHKAFQINITIENTKSSHAVVTLFLAQGIKVDSKLDINSLFMIWVTLPVLIVQLVHEASSIIAMGIQNDTPTRSLSQLNWRPHRLMLIQKVA
jgi:hypothetical protein